MKLQIISEGHESSIANGPKNKIKIDGQFLDDIHPTVTYSRGLNVVLLNSRDGSLKLAQTFDTCQPPPPLSYNDKQNILYYASHPHHPRRHKTNTISLLEGQIVRNDYTTAYSLLVNFLDQNLQDDDILIIFVLNNAQYNGGRDLSFSANSIPEYRSRWGWQPYVDNNHAYYEKSLQYRLKSLGSVKIETLGANCPWIFCQQNGKVLIDESGASGSILSREIHIDLAIEQEKAAEETAKRQEERAFKQQLAESLILKQAAEEREKAAHLKMVQAQQKQIEMQESIHRQDINGHLEEQLDEVSANNSNIDQIVSSLAETFTWLKSLENDTINIKTEILEQSFKELKQALPENIVLFSNAYKLVKENLKKEGELQGQQTISKTT